MDLLTTYSFQILAVTALLLSLLVIVALTVVVSRGRREIQQLASSVVVLHEQMQKTQRASLTLQSRLQAVHKQGSIVEKRISELDTRLELTAGRQQEIEFRDMGSLSYAHASKLVKMGAAPEDLVSSCGLSAAEARLSGGGSA